MRILDFEVERQRVKRSQSCDFSGLVAGSVGYLRARFNFVGSDWQNCRAIVARFWIDDKEYATTLDKENGCEIPSEVLKEEKFAVSVLGANTAYRIETNKVYVRQEVH